MTKLYLPGVPLWYFFISSAVETNFSSFDFFDGEGSTERARRVKEKGCTFVLVDPDEETDDVLVNKRLVQCLTIFSSSKLPEREINC